MQSVGHDPHSAGFGEPAFIQACGDFELRRSSADEVATVQRRIGRTIESDAPVFMRTTEEKVVVAFYQPASRIGVVVSVNGSNAGYWGANREADFRRMLATIVGE